MDLIQPEVSRLTSVIQLYVQLQVVHVHSCTSRTMNIKYSVLPSFRTL